MTANLSAETLQARRNGRIYLKYWKGKIYTQDYCTQQEITGNFFKIDGEIKSFSDKQKLGEFSTTKPVLQPTLKKLLQSRNARRKKNLQNQPQTIKKMAIGTYISIITLKDNGLNVPTKIHKLDEWIQKQNPLIYCLQETHLHP